MNKPYLCLDFDGVLHSYASGWQGADVIPDPPVPGAMEFLERARAKFTLAIYSSRSSQPNGILAMRTWLQLQLGRYCQGEEALAEEIFAAIEWPEHKPAAFLTIDDRALTFDGKWPDVDTLLEFKPWNKRPLSDDVNGAMSELDRLRGIIERDRTIFCALINDLKRVVTSRQQLGKENARAASGYSYDEAGFIQEFSDAYDAIMESLEKALRLFRDFTDCPTGDQLAAAKTEAVAILARNTTTELPAELERQTGAHSPSYDALLLIAQSVSAALARAGVTDCDDPGEAIDVMRERYELKIATLAAMPLEDVPERCEGGTTECGPVEHHDSEGVPLCSKCWSALLKESASGTNPAFTDCPVCTGTGEVADADGNGELCGYCEGSGNVIGVADGGHNG